MVKVNKKQSISLTKMSFSKEDQPILCLRYKSNQKESVCQIRLPPVTARCTPTPLVLAAGCYSSQPALQPPMSSSTRLN